MFVKLDEPEPNGTLARDGAIIRVHENHRCPRNDSHRAAGSPPATREWLSLGEMGGGGESAVAAIGATKAYLMGRDPARLEEMRFLLANPTASLYNNRTQIVAAIEFACLDLLGQSWGVPVCDILGGRLNEALAREESPITHEVGSLATRALEHHIERHLRAVAMFERH